LHVVPDRRVSGELLPAPVGLDDLPAAGTRVLLLRLPMLLFTSSLRLVPMPGLLRRRLVPSWSSPMRIMWIMRQLRENPSLAAMGLEMMELIC
jgi:hypothetical protein